VLLFKKKKLQKSTKALEKHKKTGGKAAGKKAEERIRQRDGRGEDDL